MTRIFMRHDTVIAAFILTLSQTSVADERLESQTIADEGIEAAAPPNLDAQALYDTRFAEQNFIEAVDAGKLVLNQLVAKGETSGKGYGAALEQLADAQLQADQAAAAVENYEAAARIYEAAADRLDESLYEPHVGLARAHAAVGDYWSAAGQYERALHLYNVNSGLLDVEQMNLLAEMSENYYTIGDFKQANSLQRFRLDVARRNFPGNDVRTLPAWYARADMLGRTGDHIKAQEMYRRAIQLIERAEGRNSMTLIPALSKLADSYLYNVIIDGKNGPDQAERRLRRIIGILRRNEAATPLQLADAHISMGDFEYLRGDYIAGAASYRLAWDVFEDNPDLAVDRDKRFAKPVALNGLQVIQEQELAEKRRARLQRGPRTPEEELIDGHVTVEYDVNPRGEVRNLRIVESTPPGLNDNKVLRTLRDFIFRPKIVDRKAVRATGIRYTSTFKYRPDEVGQVNKVVAEQNSSR